MKRAHYGRPAAAVVWGGRWITAFIWASVLVVWSWRPQTDTQKKTAKHSKLKKRKAAQIDTCNTDTQISPFHTFFHIDRIRNTFSWVCQAAPLTKKHLGTGLVGLQRIHICPVQAIGIQSFRLSNATRREQSRAALFFAFAAPLWGGLLCWANNASVNTRFYCSSRGISGSDRLCCPGLKCWLGGSRRTDVRLRGFTYTATCFCWSVPPLQIWILILQREEREAL